LGRGGTRVIKSDRGKLYWLKPKRGKKLVLVLCAGLKTFSSLLVEKKGGWILIYLVKEKAVEKLSEQDKLY